MGDIPIPAYVPVRRTPMRSFMQQETGDACGVPRQSLLLINEMAAAVLLPASFVAFCAEGLFLAVADGFDPAGAGGGPGRTRAASGPADTSVVAGCGNGADAERMMVAQPRRRSPGHDPRGRAWPKSVRRWSRTCGKSWSARGIRWLTVTRSASSSR